MAVCTTRARLREGGAAQAVEAWLAGVDLDDDETDPRGCGEDGLDVRDLERRELLAFRRGQCVGEGRRKECSGGRAAEEERQRGSAAECGQTKQVTSMHDRTPVEEDRTGNGRPREKPASSEPVGCWSRVCLHLTRQRDGIWQRARSRKRQKVRVDNPSPIVHCRWIALKPVPQ